MENEMTLRCTKRIDAPFVGFDVKSATLEYNIFLVRKQLHDVSISSCIYLRAAAEMSGDASGRKDQILARQFLLCNLIL